MQFLEGLFATLRRAGVLQSQRGVKGADGRIVHVPRLLVDPDADWVAELAELPSDCGVTAVSEIAAEGGIGNAAFMNAADIGAVQVAAVTGGLSLSDPTRPSVGQIGGAVLYPAPLAAGTALVADARFIAVAVRRDASVDLSEHAAFTKAGVVARVTMRVDFAPSDPSAFRLIT